MKVRNMIIVRRGSREEMESMYPLFCEEFPPEERKTLDHLRHLLDLGRYKFMMAEVDGIGPIGFSFLYESKDKTFYWLDYIAIEKSFQSKGYGSQFYRALLEHEPTIEQIFIEIEIPTGRDDNQLRRIRYYERLGATDLGLDYWLPTPEGCLSMFLYGAKDSSHWTNEQYLTAIQEALNYIHADLEHLPEVLSKIVNQNRKLNSDINSNLKSDINSNLNSNLNRDIK